MAREYVESTSIAWFDYDDDARTLDIAYAGGGAYRYHDVPRTVRDALRAADSKGHYVNAVVKPGYRFTRLTGEG